MGEDVYRDRDNNRILEMNGYGYSHSNGYGYDRGR